VLARARIVVERDGGRSVVRELRSQPPLSLLPRRGTAAARSPVATVHMVGSATTPLGGDDVALDVVVGEGADLVLTGVAAALALPGQGAAAASRLIVRLRLGDGAGVQYLPEPTVVTRRADHHAELHAELGAGARLRCREVLVAGRSEEPSGRYRGLTRVQDCATGRPLLVQGQELGDPDLQASAAHLAGRRVLGTEVLVWGADPDEALAGTWWSLTPLAGRGSLATAVGPDAVSADRALAQAIAGHPGWSASVLATAHP
jgi:urease accessory protein